MISPAFTLNIVGTEQCDDNLQHNELGEFLRGKAAIISFIFGETYKTALADISESKGISLSILSLLSPW